MVISLVQIASNAPQDLRLQSLAELEGPSAPKLSVRSVPRTTTLIPTRLRVVNPVQPVVQMK